MKFKTLIAMVSVTVFAFVGVDDVQAQSNNERKRIQSNSYQKRHVQHQKHQSKHRRRVVHHRPNPHRVVTHSQRRVVRPVHRRPVVRYRHVHQHRRPVHIVSHPHMHYYGDGCFDNGSSIFWNFHIGHGGSGLYFGR